MKSKFYIPLLALSVLAFSGYAGTQLNELESAVIKKDYPLAKSLAVTLLNQPQGLERADVVNYYLGVAHISLEEYEQAHAPLKKAIEITTDPQLHDKAYLALFDSYYLIGEYKEAAKIIEKLKKKSSDSQFLSLIYLKAARVNLKLANWDKAEGYLKKIIHGFPESLEYHTAQQLLEEKQYYTVQVGAFIDQPRAQQLVSQLQAVNEYAYIVETVDRENRTLYRVRVGQIARLQEAEQLSARIAQLGYPAQVYP